MNSKKKKKTIDTIPLRKKKGKLIEEEHQLKASIYDPKLKLLNTSSLTTTKALIHNITS